MQQTATAAPARATLSARPGASRKLLQRKAAERGADAVAEEPALEASFPAAETPGDAGGDIVAVVAPADASGAAVAEPVAAADQPDPSAVAPSEPESAPLDAAPPAPAQASAAAPAWSGEDESALQAMLARRKAAGYQPSRGKDVSAQLIRAGAIKPNDGTVVAAIVSIVAARGAVRRGELLDLMAAVAFTQAKARPGDRGWCQGYVAGAVRDGFLSVAPDDAAAGTAIDSSIVEVTA